MDNLVSIITPMYNAEKYISETIVSVLSQTYQNWEMIIIDDGSTDKSKIFVSNFVKQDPRIKLIITGVNSGVAAARNVALSVSRGRFIAFLDADDLWHDDKLEKQVAFMIKNKIGFSCASYEVINDDGILKGKSVIMKERLDYKGLLMNNYLQTVGIMVDVSLIDKRLLVNPLKKIGEDAATWLYILKNGHICYGMNAVLAKYRRTKNSLSSNKFESVKEAWFLYRRIEKLPLYFACYCFIRYALLAVWKRLYFLNK